MREVFPGATGYLSIDDYGQLLYGVRFSNGHQVEDHDEIAMVKAAALYWQATLKLTGVAP